MNKFAWMTYLDKKDYLPGLQGLYYSLQRVNTKYDLIVIYSGNVKKEDIEKYIEIKKVILFPVEEHVFSPGILKEHIDERSFAKSKKSQQIAHTVYCRWQKSNIFGPLCAYGFTEYDKIFYLHCDIILKQNLDFIFNLFLEDKTYVAAFSEDGTINSTRLLCITPNKKVYDFISENISILEKDKQIITIDSFIDKYLVKLKLIKIGQIPYMKSFENMLFHFGGIVKYWTAFPNLPIKEILTNQESDWVTAFQTIITKTQELEFKYGINDLIDKTIWKNDKNLFNDFCNKTKEITWLT